LYADIKSDENVMAYKYRRYAKVDVVVNVDGIEKGISIKSGKCNSVHVEPIDKFILFLEKQCFKESDKLLRYLYSNGTNDNTVKIRQPSEQYKIINKENIDIINKSLEEYSDDLTGRFLIKADVNYRVDVNKFIFGYLNDFLWATKDEILNHLIKTNIKSDSVHINNLFIQSWNKNLKYNPRYEYCRNYIQVKWYSIFDDMINILVKRNSNSIDNLMIEP